MTDPAIPTRTVAEPPEGARVELSMEDGSAAVKVYDKQGHEIPMGDEA
ncbi:hypothetical protein [Bacillus mobilis]